MFPGDVVGILPAASESKHAGPGPKPGGICTSLQSGRPEVFSGDVVGFFPGVHWGPCPVPGGMFKSSQEIGDACVCSC